MSISKKILGAGLVVLAACNSSDKPMTTETGLKYRMYTSNEGIKPQIGDYISLNIIHKTVKDSVIFSTYENGGAVEFQMTEPGFDGDLIEGLAMMATGDSATFWVSADSMFKGGTMPEFLKAGDEIKYEVKIESVMTQEEYELAKQEEMEKTKEVYAQEIEKYASENGLDVQQTTSGLYYVITQEGEGSFPETGQTVSVHYTGKLIDGKVFDSSVDRGQPIDFPLGVGQVIPGWDEGIALLKKGSKGTLIIPPYLAYGESGAGNIIPPNAILVFDVELVDIQEGV